jgi:hypothetical protein
VVKRTLLDQNVEGWTLTTDTFDIEIGPRLLKGWWFDPWQDYLNYFIKFNVQMRF